MSDILTRIDSAIPSSPAPFPDLGPEECAYVVAKLVTRLAFTGSDRNRFEALLQEALKEEMPSIPREELQAWVMENRGFLLGAVKEVEVEALRKVHRLAGLE